MNDERKMKEENSASRIHSTPSFEKEQEKGLGSEAWTGRGSSRLEWLDAMRGFTMILVVMNHVFGHGFQGNTVVSVPMSLCQLFRMPLFFFVSGFLAYKSRYVWNWVGTRVMLLKKLRMQLVPTIVFMAAYVALMRKPPFWAALGRAWSAETKAGYWFTIVLLEMFIIYYLFEWIGNLLTPKRQASDVVQAPPTRTTTFLFLALWLISLFAYATAYMPSWFHYPKDPLMTQTSFIRVIRYFHFFMFGNLVHRFWPQVQRLLDSKWLFPLLIVVAFIGAGDYLKWHTLRLQWANLPRTLAMYSLVLIVLTFFRYYKDWFTKERWVGRSLQYIGVRTLDVYLIHYFFFPHLSTLGPWFKAQGNNFVLETTVALGMSLLVIAFCLLTSNILRVSPFLKKWLFGR